MKIYYYVNHNEENIGSRNRKKIEFMSHGKEVKECDISEFYGHLMSNIWNG